MVNESNAKVRESEQERTVAQVGPLLRVMKVDPLGRRSTGQGIIGTIIGSGMQKI